MQATRRSFRTDIVMQMRLPAEQQAQKKAKVAEIQALKERLEEAEGEEDAAALTVGSPVPEACISLLLCAWLCVACTFQRGLCGVKEELKEAGDAVALALGFPVRAAGPSVMLCCVVQPSCNSEISFSWTFASRPELQEEAEGNEAALRAQAVCDCAVVHAASTQHNCV